MRFKGTLVLLLVFAVLGGYVYYSDFYHKEERQKQEEARKRLFGGEGKDISEIHLENDGKTVTAVRKGEKDWEITNPPGLEADSDTWEQLASSFVQIQKGEVVSAGKTELAPYGLDKPAVVVNVKLKGGNSAGVLFGAENPKKTFNYAKRADSDEVFLVSTSDTSAFKKSMTDLRNKKVLDFMTENIDVIRIASTGKPEIEMQKSGMDWLIKKPVEAKADAGEVSSFLSSIQFSRTSAFADDKVDAKATGVDMPAAKITLHDQKAAADRVLVFGKSPEKDKYYAKDLSRVPVFILGTEILDKVHRPLFDWRDKTIVKFGDNGTSAVDEMDIVRGTDKLSLKRSGESDWTLTDGRKAQQSKIFDMLGALDGGRALDLIDSPRSLNTYGLDKPRLEVVLREKGKPVGTVQFGKESASPAGVYLKAENPAILIVDKDLYSKFDVRQSDIVEAQPNPANPSK